MVVRLRAQHRTDHLIAVDWAQRKIEGSGLGLTELASESTRRSESLIENIFLESIRFLPQSASRTSTYALPTWPPMRWYGTSSTTNSAHSSSNCPATATIKNPRSRLFAATSTMSLASVTVSHARSPTRDTRLYEQIRRISDSTYTSRL